MLEDQANYSESPVFFPPAASLIAFTMSLDELARTSNDGISISSLVALTSLNQLSRAVPRNCCKKRTPCIFKTLLRIIRKSAKYEINPLEKIRN